MLLRGFNMSTATQKKIKPNVVVLVIGLIISIVASEIVYLFVGAYNRNYEIHTSMFVKNHNTAEIAELAQSIIQERLDIEKKK